MLVVIFDYPQIQYFSQIDADRHAIIESQDREFHQRLQLEFGIGIMVWAVGIFLTIISVLKKD